MAQEFERHTPRDPLPMPPPMAFPEDGTPESEVLGEVQARLSEDPFSVERNFGITYVGPPHPDRGARRDARARHLLRGVGA